jgi:hypothetical protein
VLEALVDRLQETIRWHEAREARLKTRQARRKKKTRCSSKKNKMKNTERTHRQHIIDWT